MKIWLWLICLTAGAAVAADVPVTEMVTLPAGEFTMGRAESSEEYTPHPVRLKAFMMDVHEVTNAQYQVFCEETGAKLPVFWGLDRFRCGADFPDHPVVGVNHVSAVKYAEWAGKRLPTEAEWEYAARGGLEGLKFDLADTLAEGAANTKAAKLDGPVAAASFRPNAYGLYDMVGNVREWTADYFADDYFAVSPVDNPQGPEKTRWRVIKGGGWFSGNACNTVNRRNALPAGWGDFNVGFRCAKDIED